MIIKHVYNDDLNFQNVDVYDLYSPLGSIET